MDERVVWIDTARGMGIVLVVYGHVMRGLWHAGLAVPSPVTLALDQLVYGFHMPMFFLLSGLLLGGPVAHQNPDSFLRSKLGSLAWPYLVWSLIQGGIEALAAPLTNGGITFTEVWQHLWLPRQQFWFLYVLFWASLGLYGALRLGQALGLGAARSAGAVAVLVGALIHGVPGGLLQSGLYYSGFMLLGWWWSRRRPLERPVPPASTALLCGTAVLSSVLFLATTAPATGALLHPRTWGYAWVMSWLMVRLAQGTPALGRAFGLLGRASLFIYVTHVIFAGGGRIVAQHLLGLHNAWGHLLIGLLLGLFAPLLLYAARGHPAVAWLFAPRMPTFGRPVLKAPTP